MTDIAIRVDNLSKLSRITEPTSGRAETCGGRVGSLLLWQMHSFSRSADRGKLWMQSLLANRKIDVRQDLCELKERRYAIGHRLSTAIA